MSRTPWQSSQYTQRGSSICILGGKDNDSATSQVGLGAGTDGGTERGLRLCGGTKWWD